MNKLIGILLAVFISTIGLYSQSDHPQVSFVKAELIKNNIATKEIYVTDHYTSRGVTHTYYKESIDGIPVFNSRGAIHYKTIDAIVNKTNFRNLKKSSRVSIKPIITAEEAIQNVVLKKNLNRNAEYAQLEIAREREKKQLISAPQISIGPIPIKLQYYINETNELRLVWELSIEDVLTAWYTDYLIDAETGEILEEIDWTIECDHGMTDHSTTKHCNRKHETENHTDAAKLSESVMVPNTYEVFDLPVESPNFGSRTINTSPWDDNLDASPSGWHVIQTDSFTTSRGNNTDTYLDNNKTNSPTGGDAARAEGGPNLEFVFPLDVDGNPVDYTNAAITNTFFWTNLMHDVWYNYGFDEQSGNFQEENYTNNGNGSDYVKSEVQDGSGSCNANFGTPADGGNPRMQMYLCGNRDGDYDNGVIAHEYGHGISNRLTGGPGASGCLGNSEQMGEGWSDFFGMVMTIDSLDLETDARSVGTWLFGQGPNGGGIRPYPYTTDKGVNPMTYDFVARNNISRPHGIGSVWCTMLWDLTWALIAEYGFDSDIYDGTGGNNIAMELVMEGMKLQSCNPGFVDGRDAILQADELLNAGVNEAMLWEVFANRGLGYSADQGSSNNRYDGIEAFDTPTKIIKSTMSTNAVEDDIIVYSIIVENNYEAFNIADFLLMDTLPDELVFISASDGGTASAGIISFPVFDLTAGSSKTVTITVSVKSGVDSNIEDFIDDIENGGGNWTTSNTGNTNWSISNTASNSGTDAWFAPNNSSTGTAKLDIVPIGLGSNSQFSFYHSYNTQSQNDGGRIFISIDNGLTFIDLGESMLINGYRNTVYANELYKSVPGFSGNSGGFISTIIDLSDYSDEDIIIRFQMDTNQSGGGSGWWIDDVSINNLDLNIVNYANGESGIVNARGKSTKIKVDKDPTDLTSDIEFTWVSCNGDMDGEAIVSTQGGSGTYTYLWNDGNTSSTRTGLSSGIYKVTVSDGANQVIKAGIVGAPSLLELTFTSTLVTNPIQDNGSAMAIVQGGAKPYTYGWDNGITTQSISNLTTGIYSLTVTDAGGCTITGTVEIEKYNCGDKFYDSGGPGSNYKDLEDITTTICPDNEDEGITITFNSFNIEANWDALYIHNGNSTSFPLFSSGNPATSAGFPAGGYYGTGNPGSFISTHETGCVTLRMRSDQYVTKSGWDIDISCNVLCSDSVNNQDNDGWSSLRRTIECADSGDIIPVSSALNMDTIFLVNKIIIDKEIKLEIPGNNEYFISLNIAEPIFEITPIGSLEIGNVKLLSGTLSIGGAIINDGILILNDVDVIGNVNTPNPETLILNNDNLQVVGEVNIKKD